MKHDELMDVLMKTAIGIHKVMGKNTEIVLHDLRKHETAYIVNGIISGRDKSYKIPLDTSAAIISLADEDGHLIGIGKALANVGTLRASHFIYSDDDGPCAIICINQDLNKIEEFRNYLDQLLKPRNNYNEQAGIEENYIIKIAKQILLDTMEDFSSAELASKEGRLKLLTRLYESGVLSVRDAPSMICKAMGISSSSLYNYLRELKETGVIEDEPKLTL
ncbi:MAG TPA: hypothetical protein GX736_03405 [Mogibacterium sp.]|nr:hypothetical protein [Mogibacterium sp.]